MKTPPQWRGRLAPPSVVTCPQCPARKPTREDRRGSDGVGIPRRHLRKHLQTVHGAERKRLAA